MTPREFFNAWVGWSENRSEQMEAQQKGLRNTLFAGLRWHASSTAWSKEQGRRIGNKKFSWEKKKKPKNEPNVHQKIASFIRREERRLNRGD